ncbi:unnamed protein product [Allacma fusca]|uniref:Brinker DNA-binding domain-containing protein n=2 Tax=Allacma fusca TaxID=39272 RepID=A0A8J2KAN4_9HEXA|nr:unnamed protein product [Allacma fusca]
MYVVVHISSPRSQKEQINPHWNPVQIDKRLEKRSSVGTKESKKAVDSSTGQKIRWKLSKTTCSISSSPAGAPTNKESHSSKGYKNIRNIKTNIVNSWKRKHPSENCKLSASLLNNITGTSGGGNSSARRIFTAEFKKSVVDAFTHDPECIGNQRATARKFRIHRRQVQKWIQQRSPVKVSSSDDPPNTEVPLPPSSGLRSPPKSVMANAINTLLSLRDSVRIKAPWSPQNPSSQTITAALNLGLLSNSASMLHEMDPSPPLNQSINNSKNATQARQESHRSPRISPQSSNSISPSNRNQGSRQYSGNSNGLNNDTDLLTPSEIIDELTYLYPQEDFTLLRKACLKNEITLTKLSTRLAYCYPTTMTPSPSGPNSNGNENGSLKDDFMTQQTLQLIKQQNEYVQMLQQSGVSLPVFPSDMTMAGGLNLSNMADSHHSSSKYPSWFHPLAQAAAAAAAGINIPTGNGGSGNANGKKKNDHLFLSPKTPALSSNKPKTVAAALAASRHSPNIIGSLVGNGKSKKPALPRKRQQRQKPSTITRPSLVMMEDEIDPSTMVETTTTVPPDYGMDLSTVSFKGNDLTSSSKRSKNEPLYSHVEIPQMSSPDSNTKSNGHNLLNAASLTLENYLRNVLPTKKSPNNSTEPDPITTTLSESDKKKQHVLDAFNDDPEVAGDARGVARKFGLNIRVVLKWLREGPSKSLPALPPLLGKTNGINSILDANMLTDLNLNLNLTNEQLLTNGDSHSKGGSFISANIQKKHLPNKRKNTKPNQICDFQNDDLPDDADTVPLDMVVPIKKRRVSNSNAC